MHVGDASFNGSGAGLNDAGDLPDRNNSERTEQGFAWVSSSGIRHRQSADGRTRRDAFEFEQPSFLTLGVCYEERPRMSGGAYQSILRRTDDFLDAPMSKAVLPQGVCRGARALHAVRQGAGD